MLEVRDLRVVYANGYEALRSVNLTVRDGEIVAVIGRSGAGKSTLLRCVNGLQPVTAGEVLLDGADVAAMDAARLQDLRRACGFIWQEYNLVGRLSVMKNVLAGRLGHHRGPTSLLHYFDRRHRAVALRRLAERADSGPLRRRRRRGGDRGQ